MDDTDSLSPGVRNWLAENKWQAVIGLFGLFLCLVGLGQWLDLQKIDQESVVVVESDEVSESTVIIDISGAVESPGVYSVSNDSRLGEAIEKAGGLKSDADIDWISKTLNLAQPIKDGMKIYVPFSNENDISGVDGQGEMYKDSIGDDSKSNKININSASQSELESLWGVGESRAKNIIDARPYESTEQIIDKGGVPQSVFERIKEQISVY